jgi:hypothetical protein
LHNEEDNERQLRDTIDDLQLKLRNMDDHIENLLSEKQDAGA